MTAASARLVYKRLPCPFILAALLTLTHCDGPTEPNGPYRFEVLFALRSPGRHTHASWGHAIDPSGRVVGMSAVARQGEADAATLWGLDGAPTILDAGDVLFERANGINALGQVVGKGRCSDVGSTIISEFACISENGQARTLGSHGNYHGHSSAAAINNAGYAVGWSEVDPTGAQHAVLWRDGLVIDLGTLGGRQSEALDINEIGQIVGWARPGEPASGSRHAFLWQGDSMIDIGTLGGEESIAHAINDSGQIVGWLGDIGGKRAFIWENGTLRLLPGGTEFSQAFAINNRGDVVGSYISVRPEGTAFHAALWRDGVRYDLHDLVGAHRMTSTQGVTLTWATGINDAGQITGVGSRPAGGSEFAFRLTPR